MGYAYWQPQKPREGCKTTTQRQETKKGTFFFFNTIKGVRGKKGEKRSSQEVMNIAIASLSIKLPNSQNPWGWAFFLVKTLKNLSFVSGLLQGKVETAQEPDRAGGTIRKKVMPRELSEIVEGMWT